MVWSMDFVLVQSVTTSLGLHLGIIQILPIQAHSYFTSGLHLGYFFKPCSVPYWDSYEFNVQVSEKPLPIQLILPSSKLSKNSLITKERIWIVDYVKDHLTGKGWIDFVAAHTLLTGNVLILSPDENLNLYALVIG